VSLTNSEINQIEEVFVLQDHEKPKQINTEVRVQVSRNKIQSSQLFLGLLDTGATGIFVKRDVLKYFDHKITKANIQVKGRYALSTLKEIAHFTIKLPDFFNSKTIDIEAFVEDSVVGRHDFVLGVKFIQQLGLIFDFQKHIVSWDEISIPMRQTGTIKPEELTTVSQNDSLLLQKAVNRMDCSITSNTYHNHNYSQWYSIVPT
jgi:predicted aspartyl protease